MDNAYISSTVYALREKGSLSSIYFNDYKNSSYDSLNDRFDRYRNRSSLSKCCSCCGVSSPKVTTIINRSYLYGPRQSSLLHWSAYRKLILSGGDRFCNYIYSNNNYKCHGVKRDCCCEVSSCVIESSVCSNSNNWRKSRVLCCCRCVANDGDSGDDYDNDDTEALLSLFSEEVGGGGIKRRNRGLIKNVEVRGRDSKNSDSYERDSEVKKKKESGWRLVESDGKRGIESGRIESKSTREFSRGEENQSRGARRESSSSYYSVSSSSGDFDEESEVHDKHELYEVSRVNSERNEHQEASKSEKKRNERSSKEVQESSQRRERVSTGSHERFHDTKEASSISHEVGETSVSRRKSEENKEIRDFKRDDAKSTSQSRARLESMEEKAEIEKRDERRRDISYNAVEQNIKRNTQQARIVSEAEDHDIQRTSVLQNRAETGVADVEYREYRENVSSKLQEREDRSQGQTRQQAARISEIFDIDANVEKTSIAQSQTSITNQVNNTNLISVSYERATEPHAQTSQRLPQRVQSESRSHIADDTNVVRASETERIMDSRVTSETRLRRESEETHVRMVTGNTRISTDQSDEIRRPIRPRKELQKASDSQEFLRLDYPAIAQKDKVEEGSHRSTQTVVSPPRSQLLSRTSVRAELESGFERQKVLDTNSRRQPLDLLEASYERTESHELPYKPIYPAGPEDALGSAERSLESSTQFVEEFVEKARLEASSSGTHRVGEVSEVRLASEGDQASSSGGSGTKGPSAEMWDVVDPLVAKTPEAEEPKPAATENKAVVKRSGKSMWSVIGDIVTLKWGMRSEPVTVSSASSQRQNHPSDESAVSEAWFSTNESELSRGKNSKVSRSDPRSDQLQVTEFSTPARGTESDGFTDPLPLRSKAGSGSTSQRISVSGSENLGWNESSIGRSSQASPAGMEIAKSPLRPSTGVEIPTIVPQVSGSVKMDVGSGKKLEQPGTENAPEASEVIEEGNTGGELKRRKFQRIKQVPKDRFDEWEEAFTVETEQRRLDELFMREALLEANKAADMWEVPVGAVLVQNGTIIARGYNLVEELRDSTAHAEMICIREASNQLRSWRLADTTLYVTLEPCPMCAGAILQARVNTLVWGAPNTLLGADGSWIRLFPDGGDGEGSKSEKPAPSPHPFHPNMNIRRGVLATECAEVMKQFFQLRRKNKKDKEKQEAEETHSSRLSVANPSKLLKKMHNVFHVMFCL